VCFSAADLNIKSNVKKNMPTLADFTINSGKLLKIIGILQHMISTFALLVNPHQQLKKF
jgi:hypothetical protein